MAAKPQVWADAGLMIFWKKRESEEEVGKMEWEDGIGLDFNGPQKERSILRRVESYDHHSTALACSLFFFSPRDKTKHQLETREDHHCHHFPFH